MTNSEMWVVLGPRAKDALATAIGAILSDVGRPVLLTFYDPQYVRNGAANPERTIRVHYKANPQEQIKLTALLGRNQAVLDMYHDPSAPRRKTRRIVISSGDHEACGKLLVACKLLADGHRVKLRGSTGAELRVVNLGSALLGLAA